MTAQLRVVHGGPLRFGIAVRVSQVRGRAGDSFHSPQTQESNARRAVEAAGGVVDPTVGENGVFYDLDVSGAIAPSDRPGMGEALDLVRAGRLDGIAVYDVSRWARDTVSGLRELEEVAAIGGQVLSAAETIDLKTPSGLFTTTVILAAARMKRDETAKKWQEVHERRHGQGLSHAGKLPLGYVNEQGRAVVDPVLGPLITWAFRSYLAGSVSQKHIAARLTAARGRQVRQGTVSNLLRNPFHTGQVTYRGRLRPGLHTPLVDQGTFDAVQRKLARDLLLAPRTRGPVTFSTGLLLCATCSKTLNRRGRGRASDGHRPRLRCPTIGCEGVGAPFVDEVEAALLDQALKVAAGYGDGAPAVLARRQQAKATRSEQQQLTREHTQLVKAIDRAAEKLTAGVLTDEEYLRLVQPMRDRLAALVEQVGQLEDAPVHRPMAELRDAAERLRQLLKGGMTALETRAAVGCFIERACLRRAAYRGEPIADRLSFPDALE